MATKKPASKKKSGKSLPKDIIYIAIIAILVIALLVVIFAGDKLSIGLGSTNNDVEKPYTSLLSGKENFTLPSQFDGNECLEVHFIDVGQGDAIAIMFPDGKKMLIDAGNGSSKNPNTAIKNNYFNYLSDNLALTEGSTIDYLVVTHPDADHVNMMSQVLSTYDVDNIYYNDAGNAKEMSKTYEKFMQDVESEEGAVRYPVGTSAMAQHITGVGYTVDLYAPGYETFREEAVEDTNKNILSIICILTYGGRKVIFTGDAEVPTEEWFMQTVGGTMLDVDVLKVGHHGSYSCTSTQFLDFIKPEYAVISCDNGQAYHHPHPETMNTLFDYGVVTYRTNRHGNIVLYIADDGDFGFLPEKNVPTENNTKDRNPNTITLSKNDD